MWTMCSVGRSVVGDTHDVLAYLLAIVRKVVAVLDLAAVRLEGGGVVAERVAPAALEPLHAPLLRAPRRLEIVQLRQRDRRLVARLARLHARRRHGLKGAARRARVALRRRVRQRVVVLACIQQVCGAVLAALCVAQQAERLARHDHELCLEVLGQHEHLRLAAPVGIVPDPLHVRLDRVVPQHDRPARRVGVGQHRLSTDLTQLPARRPQLHLAACPLAQVCHRREEAAVVGRNSVADDVRARAHVCARQGVITVQSAD